MDKSYLQEVRALCDEENIALIFDEIQCGIARTGSFFAFEQYDVQPDLLTLAKALGGGTPIGCFLMTEEIAQSIDYGEHGTTFGGNPLVTAAALATLQVIDDENLTQQAAKKGKELKERLQKASQQEDAIKEVRGKGLMIGVELEFEGQEVVQKMLEKGVISNCAANTVIRLVPPLNISEEDLNTVVDTLLESIEEVK
jgi:acetylornithine/N-succinyldiaminopimelate aminotransferase